MEPGLTSDWLFDTSALKPKRALAFLLRGADGPNTLMDVLVRAVVFEIKDRSEKSRSRETDGESEQRSFLFSQAETYRRLQLTTTKINWPFLLYFWPLLLPPALLIGSCAPLTLTYFERGNALCTGRAADRIFS